MSKVVFITGASFGIGKAIGEYLHQNGYKVYGTSRNPNNTNKVPFELLQLDVTDTASIDLAVGVVYKKEGRIDVLINNAGVGITGPIEETNLDNMRTACMTNFFGPLEMVKAVLPIMRNQKSGMIINITSIAGYFGLPFRGIYSASKAALKVATETLSMELKPFGIKVTTVAPGDFLTNISESRFHSPIFEESAYRESYETSLALMDTDVKKGRDPIIVAKRIHKIIESKRPRLHYKVGGPLEKSSIKIKRILSGRLFEQMLMNHYRL